MVDLISFFAVSAFFLSLFNTYILLQRKYVKPEDVSGFLTILLEILQLIKSKPNPSSEDIDRIIQLLQKELAKIGHST